MFTDNFCKCANCDTVLFDMNPQVDANEYPLEQYPDAKEMIFMENELFWACPECLTDEHLIDL